MASIQPATSIEAPAVERERLSILHGPVDPPLVDFTLGELLELQCQQYGTEECVVIPWTGARWTYNELNQQSCLIARALLSMGVGMGDRVGIMAGNCEQYIAVFFAVARIGGILVILNNTYTKTEAQYALGFTGMSFGLFSFFFFLCQVYMVLGSPSLTASFLGLIDCKVFFTTRHIGRLDNEPLLAELAEQPGSPTVVILRGDSGRFMTCKDVLHSGIRYSPRSLHEAQLKVLPYNVCNLQFTSGTTGRPKAAMLTHQ